MNLSKIDRLVAEHVMGWEEFEDSSGYKWWTLNEDGNTKLICSLRCFEPSRDIRDAWRVVEKIAQTIGLYQLIQGADFWIAEIQTVNSAYSVEAKTAPLAICLAALKSVGIEIEKEER